MVLADATFKEIRPQHSNSNYTQFGSIFKRTFAFNCMEKFIENRIVNNLSNKLIFIEIEIPPITTSLLIAKPIQTAIKGCL